MKNNVLLLLLILTGGMLRAQHEQHTPKPSRQAEVKDSRVKNNQNAKKHSGKRVEYDLYVKDSIVGYVSKKVEAIAVNGGVPAPTLYFTEGDTAVIRVHNRMKEETSVHWHGLLLPNEEDGVPYLTTAPIKPGTTHTFRFPLIQSGTYWYHSHTSVQEQIGTYGSIVIYPREYEKENETVIMLSDWVEQKPHSVMRTLKRASDWYAIRKNAVQSWGEALVQGYLADRFKTEWNRMPAMDVSDVYYDKFLLNGRTESNYEDLKPGQKVRLRVINGAATSYFWLQFAGGKMRVVASDGLAIVPIEVDRLMIAIAETYDIEVTLPDDGMAYEFRATSIDIAGHSSLFLGKGMKMKAPDLPKLDYFAMMREMNQMGSHSGMDMSGKDVNDMKGMDHGNMKGMDHGEMDNKGQDSTVTHDNHGQQNDGKKRQTTEEKKQSQDNMQEMDHDKMQMKGSDTTMNHDGHDGMQTDSKHDENKTSKKVGNESMPGMDHGNMNQDTIPPKTTKQVVEKDSAITEKAVMDHTSMAPGNKDDGNKGEVIFDYNMLRSPESTVLDMKKPMREVALTLTGNMIRYVWSFDSKPLSNRIK